MLKAIKTLAGAVLVASVLGGPALAQEYPDKPVTVVVPFNPGGGTDMQARLIEQAFGKEFGQPLSFVYKPGAGGAIGATELASTEADGYTIAVYTFPLIAMNAVNGTGQYDVDDFDYLAASASDPIVLVTRKKSDYTTFDELKAAVTEAPGRLSIGAVESFGPSHLAALWAKDQGLDVNVVPFPGGAKGLAAVQGGHVDALFAPLGALLTAGDSLNYLASATSERLPDMPTLADKGYDVQSVASRIWIAPAGLPDDVRVRLKDGLRNIYADESVQQKNAEAGQVVSYEDGDQLKAMIDRFTPLAKTMIEKYGDQ